MEVARIGVGGGGRPRSGIGKACLMGKTVCVFVCCGIYILLGDRVLNTHEHNIETVIQLIAHRLRWSAVQSYRNIDTHTQHSTLHTHGSVIKLRVHEYCTPHTQKRRPATDVSFTFVHESHCASNSSDWGNRTPPNTTTTTTTA